MHKNFMNDDKRIQALKALNILDTGNEEMFDEITQLASILCETPISLVSLLDAHRQYFKSNRGLTVRETPIEMAFCKYAIEEGTGLYEVNDTQESELFVSNPLVTGEPFIRYYLGAPVFDNTGTALGTLCVIDTIPRSLSENQKECLLFLSKQVTRLLEMRKQRMELTDLNEHLWLFSEKMSRFSSIAAHDIKEPLRMIKSFIDLLNRKNGAIWDEKDLKYMHFVLDGTARLDNYIEGLLNFTKSLSLKDCYIPFDFNSVLSEIESQIFITYFNSNIIFEKRVEIGSNMKLPEAAVLSICKNLLENAFKFSAMVNSPNVQFVVEERPDSYFFSIIDNGIGVPEQKLQEVFKPFVRLNRRSEFDGLGLGLAIVESQVQFLKGELHIESAELKGTKIEVILPKLENE